MKLCSYLLLCAALLILNPHISGADGTYTVKKGDSLYKIARKFKVRPEEIQKVNGLSSGRIRPGSRITIPSNKHDAERHEEIKTLSKSPDLMSLTMKERLILFAKKMLNIPYKFGGSGFFGIDCSGYVQKVFGFLNIPLPRTAREQFGFGESILKEELSIGDLVFFRTYASFPSHVGIYIGNNLFIHASSRGRKVTIDSLETPYYSARFIGGKRLIQ